MGLTIHYRGRLDPRASLPDLMEEVKNIAEVNAWAYILFQDEFPEHGYSDKDIKNELFGLIVNIPECEPLFLCFTSDRRLANPVWLDLAGSGNLKDEELLYLVFTKAQFAGIEAHKKIVHLLKYLSRKYFEEFTVWDDGQYWETGDDQILASQFNKYDHILGAFSERLASITLDGNETANDLVDRIVQLLKNNPGFKGLDE